MNKYFRYAVHAIALIAILTPLFFNVSKAQNQNGGRESLTLSPAVARPTVKAGQVIEDTITVINDGEVDYDFIVYARPYSVSDEDYNPNYTTVNDRTEAYQWVTFSQTNYSLKAGERVEIPYTLKVPDNVKGGGNYAVLFAETQPELAEGVPNIARKKRVGMLVYAQAEGDIQESGRIESFDASFLQTAKPVSSSLRVKNDGNVHFQSDINVHYKDIFGRKKYELKQELLILPGTTRRIPIAWDKAPYFGLFRASGTAELLGDTHELPVKWVILMPIPAMAAVVIAVVLVVGVIIFRKLKRKKRASSSGGTR